VAFLQKLKDQIDKYRNNLKVHLIKVIIDGKEEFFVPPRTNNYLEAIFRLIKALLRRCTGRSKLPKEFGSVGSTLPYYLLMKEHPSFKEIFADDQRLTEVFAELFVKRWTPPENIVSLPKKSANQAEMGELIRIQG